MKYFSLVLIFFINFLCINCKEKIENEPLFSYDCVDTVFHYNENNVLISYGIRFYKNNLLVRSEDSYGYIVYFEYDYKNRIIKEGRINNGNNYWTEYIYGALDTISEVRCSDNTKTLYFYNQSRKMVESRSYQDNILTFQQFLFYTYFSGIEMIKYVANSNEQSFEFNISNSASIPINLDTIYNYRLKYISGFRVDSLFQFQEKQILYKKIFKYNQINQPIYKEYSSETFLEIEKFEYSQTNKILRYIHINENTYNPNSNYYYESVFFYNEYDEKIKIDFYYAPNILEAYALISNDGNYNYWHYYSAENDFLSYTKFTPTCLESIDLKSNIFEFKK